MLENIPIKPILLFLLFSFIIAFQEAYFQWDLKRFYSFEKLPKFDVEDPIIENSNILKQLCQIFSFFEIIIQFGFLFVFGNKISIWWSVFLFIVIALPPVKKGFISGFIEGIKEGNPKAYHTYMIYTFRISYLISPFLIWEMFKSINI